MKEESKGGNNSGGSVLKTPTVIDQQALLASELEKIAQQIMSQFETITWFTYRRNLE